MIENWISGNEITVPYPGTGLSPDGSYPGYSFQPTGAVESIAIGALSTENNPIIYIRYGRGKVESFALKLTPGYYGIRDDGQPTVPGIMGKNSANMTDTGGSIVWGCTLGDTYSLSKFGKYLPARCRYGRAP
jgi:hypothetical protein